MKREIDRKCLIHARVHANAQSFDRCEPLAFHSGQTTGHLRERARDLSTSGQFPSSSHKISRSTSATRAISVLSSIILPLQTFFSRVLLLRQQPFSSENLPPKRPTTTIAIKTQVFMFRYESVNSTRRFTIVAEIVSLLKKIYKRDAPFRAVFKVKTLAVLFSAYPREMKHILRNLNLPPFWRCLFLTWSNTGSPRFTDFPSLCACSESSLTNLIGSVLNRLCFQSHSKMECRWTGPEVAVGTWCLFPYCLFF